MIARWLRRFRRDEQGTIAATATLCMVMFVGCLSLAMDGGVLYIQRTQLQKAVDAAALAAAYDLPAGSTANPDAEAVSYAASNQVSTTDPNTTLTYGRTTVYDGPCATNGCPAYKVTAQRTVPAYFGPLVGFFQGTVKTTATAIASPVQSVRGAELLPYAIWDGNNPPNGSHIYAGETGVTYRGNDWVRANILPNVHQCGGINQPPCNVNWLGGTSTSNNFDGVFNFQPNQTIQENSAVSAGGNCTGSCEPLATICNLASKGLPGIMPVISSASGNGNNIQFIIEKFVEVFPNQIPACSGGLSMSTDFTGTIGPDAEFASSSGLTPGGASTSAPVLYALKLWY